jgi:hypothetical protein
MIILPFTACPVQPDQQTIRLRADQRPSINWPDDWKQPEPERHHDHPAEDDPSPMYWGLGANIHISETAAHLVVTHDSGASGNLYTTAAEPWLPVRPYVFETTRDLDNGHHFTTPWGYPINVVAADTKKHLAHPSTRKMFETQRGRGGRF